MLARMRRAPVVAVLLLLALPASASAVTDGSVVLLDRPSGFGSLPFDGASGADTHRHAISADGCFLVFQSSSDALFAGDNDAADGIYRKDRCTAGHPLVQVNTSAAGVQAEPGATAGRASISADGNYVAFWSTSRTIHPDADGTSQVYVKNMQTGAVELASRAHGSTGALAALGSLSAVISGNGRAVAFVAYGLHASNADGVSNQSSLYVRYLNADQTFLVSVKSDGTAGTGVGNQFDLSFYGGDVAFVSGSQLVAADSDGGDDAYLTRNIGPSPTQTLVSYTIGNTSGATSAEAIAISADGSNLAWLNTSVWRTTCPTTCNAANDLQFGLTPPPVQHLHSVSFAQSGTGTTPAAPTRVFWNTDGALTSGDTNVSTNGYGGSDLYAHLLSDLTATGLSRITAGTDPVGDFDGQATDDGGVAMFESGSPALPGSNGALPQVYIRRLGTTTLISEPEGQPPRAGEVLEGLVDNLHAVSGDGRVAVFTSKSPALGVTLSPNQSAFQEQIFARDVVSGATTPVSVAPDGGFGNNFSEEPTVSAAGDRVAFRSIATNLAPGVAPKTLHVYVRDLRTGTTTLLDRAGSGAPSSYGANHPVISGDGTTVVFSSDSPDLPGAPPNDTHIYAADVATGAIALVDTTADGTPANLGSQEPDVNTDGSRVAFSSYGGNLGGSDPDHLSVYVKDRTSGAVIWAAPPEDGSRVNTRAYDLSLSANGRRVAFINDDPGFGYGADGKPHIFVHDLDTGSTVFASAGAPGGLAAEQRFPSLSADGTRMTFDNYLPGTIQNVFLRDLTAGTTTPLTTGRLGSFMASLSPSGTCAAISSYSTDITEPAYGPDFAHSYLRAIGGDCPPASGGPGGGPGTAGGAPDTTAPVISRLRVTNRRFRLAGRSTALSTKAAKRGTAFTFSLSENARSTIVIERPQPGRRQGKRCVKPRKGLKKRCTRYLALFALTRAGTKQGANRIAFSGRGGKRKLRPGRYRAALVATDAAGNRSARRTVSFTVVRR
jgi:Tol biopolymer transport system component